MPASRVFPKPTESAIRMRWRGWAQGSWRAVSNWKGNWSAALEALKEETGAEIEVRLNYVARATARRGELADYLSGKRFPASA